jgi:hypothetical protein
MTKLLEKIKNLEKPCFPFVPSKEVYQFTGINRKRFGLIIAGKIDPTFKEIRLIADFFKLDYNEFIE